MPLYLGQNYVELLKCKKCGDSFKVEYEEDADGNEYPVSLNLCYHCFEDGVEEYEIRRRERIARENEY